MEVRIKSMHMRWFKGIEALDISMDGKNVDVFGMNATGKTTIFDAFTWCLFGKDSTDRSDFWVKPHDMNGEEMHNCETAVELVLTVDGAETTFCHKMVENWVRKNGQQEQVYSGNAHKYWVNGVSKSAGEYSKIVDGIVSQDVFRLITNPMAFNAIKWDKRREYLLKLSNVDIDSILLAKPEYALIADEMAAHSTDIYGLKKVKAEERKRFNEEIEQIPVRISEQKAVLEGLGDTDTEKAAAEIKAIDAEMAEIDKKSATGEALLKATREAAQKVADLEKAVISKRASEEMAQQKALRELQYSISLADTQIRAVQGTLDSVTESLAASQAEAAETEEKLKKKREEWFATDSEAEPEANVETVCPTCGQMLPESMIEEAQQRFLRQYAEQKEQQLATITEEGQRLAVKLKKLSATVSGLIEKKQSMEKTIADCEAKKEKLDIELAAEKNHTHDSSEELKALEAQLENAKAEQEKVASQMTVDSSVDLRKAELIERKNQLLKVEAKKQQADICRTRIDQLTERQKVLGVRIADAERQIMKADKFIAERCGMLEDSINSLFQTVRWSLFEKQINGGIKDACTCLVHGVQFSDANNAAKINAGLEIIDVLSGIYGVSVPVFVDNAEAVNAVRKTNAQQIKLIVTNADKELRIEKEEE